MLKYVLVLALGLVTRFSVFGQTSMHSLSGYVLDAQTSKPLEAVTIALELEVSTLGTVTDSLGFFEIENVSSGSYTLVTEYLGYASQAVFVEVPNENTLQIQLIETSTFIQTVQIEDHSDLHRKSQTSFLNQEQIQDHANQNLASLLSFITGVNTLKTGSGIAKPVVHGLYGNRLTILNNGVTQGGQQWGNDHSPEIDPLAANELKVIKGVSSLEYAGSNLGSVILVESKKIKRNRYLSGQAQYFFESNGLGHGLNLQLEQYGTALAWKINGTLKKSGDKRSSNYYLTNTGIEETNFTLQLEKSIKNRWFLGWYASTFNTEIGILRGSHIGNLTDLDLAFTQEEPFFTKNHFSYRIEAPRQVVNHHLLKWDAKYFINDQNYLDFKIATQLNSRREFDVRRSGRSDIPSLSMRKSTSFAEATYHASLERNWQLKTGLQFSYIDNTNDPQTYVLPLIPDYVSTEMGSFFIAKKQKQKSFVEFGLRYDYIYQYALAISITLPREIIHYKNHYHNLAGSFGWTYRASPRFQFSFNSGLATRNPAINELYSFGLHQGVSGIEEGDISLRPEQSIKNTINLKGQTGRYFSWDVLAYHQLIANYIYLNPQDEIRLTIRGAFPVFRYKQTNAQIYGLDFSTQFNILEALDLRILGGFLRGANLSEQLPLVNMPSSNLRAVLSYEFPFIASLGKHKVEKIRMRLNNKYVFKQTHLLEGQDFAPAPEAYNLLGLETAANINFNNDQSLRLCVQVDNLLNVKFRDYLNRQRYFADGLGINVFFGLKYSF